MKYFVIVFLLASLTVISMPTFAEIMPSTSPLVISTPYNSYISGDKVFVRVDANPNSNVTISMTDPSKNTVKHIVKATDEDGHISTSFILPFYAEQGTWILNATYGVNFDTVSFDVVALQKERMIKDITELEKYKPISVPFSKSDHVLVGTIMQVENVPENTLRYSIDVDFYLKNEQSFDFLTAISDNIQEPTGNSPAENAIISLNSPSFVKGDLVFAYLKNINGQQKILPQSFVIEKIWRSGAPGIVHTSPLKESYESGNEILFAGMVQKSEIYQSAKKDKPFDITLTIYDKQGSDVISKPLDVDANATYQYKLQTTNLPSGKYEYKINFSGGRSGELWTHDFIINSTKHISPLKQFKSGIKFHNVQCNEGLVLAQRGNSERSACVTLDTKIELTVRGWADDERLLLGCIGERVQKCYPPDNDEYRKKLQNYYYGFNEEPDSEINVSCHTLKTSKEAATFFKMPSYLPENYSFKCSFSGTPYESYLIFDNKNVQDGWISHVPELVSDGAIFIYQTDQKNAVGEKKYSTYGTATQRIQDTYDEVMSKNPSLHPQLVHINGMLAFAVDSCNDCGIQMANFTDGTIIQKSSSEAKIKFIDENGVSYLLNAGIPLSELIKVAESLQ